MSTAFKSQVEKVQSLLYGGSLSIEEILKKYQVLSTSEKEKAVKMLNKSLGNARESYHELLNSLNEVRSFIRFQEDLLETITTKDTNVRSRVYSVIVEDPETLEDNDFDKENNILDGNMEEHQDEDDDFENEIEVGDIEIETDEFEEDIDDVIEEKEDTDIEDEENVYDNDDNDQSFVSELLEDKRGRGRAPLINELIQHFQLTDKSKTSEEETVRINTLTDYNEWFNIGTERTPHQIIMNATYLASIQFLEANSKNANYSVLTRVMLNPSGAYFKGESVVIRNRYLETKEEALDYMERQMEKIQNQFFFEKSPDVIPNHGNKNSYYGFYLSREDRKNYKEVLKSIE